MSEQNEKPSKQGKHGNHYKNDKYVGLNDIDKRKAVMKNYYQTKGKTLNAIKIACYVMALKKNISMVVRMSMMLI